MKVIPVLDLLDGKVVHGIAGKRNEYKPIENSVITSSSDPIVVAQAFYTELGLDQFYIADLDLIQRSVNLFANKISISELVSDPSITIMVDGGCKELEDVKTILEQQIDQLVLGTETLESLEILEEIVTKFSSTKIILSIDLKGGKLLANNPKLQQYSVEEIVNHAEGLGLDGLIVIELQKVGQKVGSQSGPLNPTLLKIRDFAKGIPIFAGGGVRNINDLLLLQEENIAGALVATAFHKGFITKEDLQKIL
ncbi:MAG: HisA/HisF-related TIM barrel protein [Candidatus Heimdallarchaeota archaeon]